MSANSIEILDKYKSFGKNIVFATESSCWPDEYRADKFPKLSNNKNYIKILVGTAEKID